MNAAQGPGQRTTPAGTAPGHLDPALFRLVIVLLTGAIPALLDTAIVNVAVHTIGRDLHASVSSVQWVITGYLLAFAMVVPLSGWALARFGGRAAWLGSLGLFLAGSVAAGAAWNIGSLIAFRVAQGLGGGMLTPLLTTLLVQAAGAKRMGRLMAAVSLPVVVVPVFGPVVSGLIISNVSWRWCFYVNVPICLAGLVLAWRGLPPARATGGPSHLDLPGLLLLPPALAALLYGLAQVSVSGGFGSAAVIIPLSAGAVLLAGYAVYALRISATPLVDLRLLRAPAFAGASSLMFLAGLSIYGAMLLLPLYFQQARHDSALVAGLLMVPQGIGSLLPRTVAGQLSDTVGPRLVVLAGLLVAAAGTVPFALADRHPGVLLLGAALVVRGAGMGTATIAVMAGAFEGLRPADVPHASSVIRIMQFLGGSFGAAVLVALILERQVSALATATAASANALTAAFGTTFWWCTGFTVLAIIPALALPGCGAVGDRSGTQVTSAPTR